MTTPTIEAWETLPSSAYYDPLRYQEELEKIWYKNWIYVCRSEAIAEPRTYQTISIGSQNIIILRDDDGSVQAFHNTCRHRGSLLCQEVSGTLKSKCLVCPYHQWSYSLQGELKGVPFIGSPDKLPQKDLSLFPIAVHEWQGSIFINLADTGRKLFGEEIDPHINVLANWPLADIAIGYTAEFELNCNWKVFWENFQECYHCPGIHPELCDLIPLFKKAVTARLAAKEHAENGGSESLSKIKLREGAATLSMDGQIHGTVFHQLTEEEKEIGYKYLVSLPNMFMAAHPDYIRLVSMFPLGPEKLLLKAEWLFPKETLDHPGFDLMNVVEFGKLIMEQDGAVSELNQRGLRSGRLPQGILLPQEKSVHLFLEWVRREMGEK